jgi:type II secretory pathway component PulM
VQRQVDASGLTGSLVSVELVDAHQVKVVFGSVAFAAWLTWADTMQAQHLRFAAVRLEAQPAPGQVSVTATLDRPGP